MWNWFQRITAYSNYQTKILYIYLDLECSKPNVDIYQIGEII